MTAKETGLMFHALAKLLWRAGQILRAVRRIEGATGNAMKIQAINDSADKIARKIDRALGSK